MLYKMLNLSRMLPTKCFQKIFVVILYDKALQTNKLSDDEVRFTYLSDIFITNNKFLRALPQYLYQNYINK